MAAKYHVNPKSGEPGQCRARTKPCPFGGEDAHFASAEKARSAYEKTQQAPPAVRRYVLNKPALPPILLDPAPGYRPDQWYLDSTDILEYCTDAYQVDYYSEDWTDPTTIDHAMVIERFVGVERKNWDDELTRLVADKEDQWGDIHNWEVESGYYSGESPTLHPPINFEYDLQQWYYSQPNAIDARGILEHVREKGYATDDCTPLAAVKKMLREENDKTLKHIEASSHVTVGPMKFDNLAYAKDHYERITEEEPKPVSPNSKEIIGVLKHTNGNYRMIDGHHRMKWAKAHGRNDGEFIVLY